MNHTAETIGQIDLEIDVQELSERDIESLTAQLDHLKPLVPTTIEQE